MIKQIYIVLKHLSCHRLHLLCCLALFFSIVSASHAQVSYTYNNKNQLISVNWPSGDSLTFRFDDSGNILEIMSIAPVPVLLSDTTSIDIPETTSSTIAVKLDRPPVSEITAQATLLGPDQSLSIQGPGTLSFDQNNWSQYQTITILASDDPDQDNGESTLEISADGLAGLLITVREIDDDVLGFRVWGVLLPGGVISSGTIRVQNLSGQTLSTASSGGTFRLKSGTVQRRP